MRNTNSLTLSVIFQQLHRSSPVSGRNERINSIRKKKLNPNIWYYSIILDSKPDVTNSDHPTLIVQYLFTNGGIEGCLTLPQSTMMRDIWNKWWSMLRSLSIDIKSCKQSYANAANISGKHNELKMEIEQYVPSAMFFTGSSHSYNLVDNVTEESYSKASRDSHTIN